jgi:hypothetical protein
MVIAECTCENKFQDEMYGPGRRVHNYMNGGKAVIAGMDGAVGQYKGRCTVCSKEKIVHAPEKRV